MQGGALPTGSVTFYYQADVFGAANLNGSGLASFTASSNGIPAGSYDITAKYNGDGTNLVSSSALTTVVVR